MRDETHDWDAVGRTVAERLGEGPSTERHAGQREAVAMLVARPARRGPGRIVACAVAASLAVACVAGYLVMSRDEPLGFWVGEERRAGVTGAWIEPAGAWTEPVRFEDGSRVDVHAGTLVRVTDATRDEVNVLLDHGRITASVNPGRRASWHIAAGPYRVLVTGTRLSVSWEPEVEGLQVTVTKGEVRVTGPGLDGKGTTLVQGDLLRMSSGAEVAVVPEPDGDPGPAAAKAPDPQPASLPDAKTAAAPAADPVPAWRRLATEGKHEQAVAEAEKLGFDKLARTLGPVDLWDLATSARFAKKGKLAVKALTAYRERFPGSSRSDTAAFLLGRVEMELEDAPAEAAKWFETYLAESPNGQLAEEAMGRLMDAQKKAGNDARARATAKAYLSKYPGGIFAPVAESMLSK